MEHLDSVYFFFISLFSSILLTVFFSSEETKKKKSVMVLESWEGVWYILYCYVIIEFLFRLDRGGLEGVLSAMS